MPSSWLVPEVMQTSALDCGPAALKAIFAGYGVGIDYGRLRAVLQTDIDGTSIDVLEDVAEALGLDAQQLVLPPDFVVGRRSNPLPAIVVKRLPNGHCHFVVAWSNTGGVIQLMDPSVGRQWVTQKTLHRDLFRHDQPVDAQLWRALAESEVFVDPLACRLHALLAADEATAQLAAAHADPTWRGFAILDAAARMVDHLVRSRALTRGRQAARLLTSVIRRARDADNAQQLGAIVPRDCWSVWPQGDDLAPGELMMEGAVVLRLGPPRSVAKTTDSEVSEVDPEQAAATPLAAVRTHHTPAPYAEVVELLRRDGVLRLAVIVPTLALLSVATIAEALLLRAALSVGDDLALASQRWLSGAAVVGLAIVMAGLSWSVASLVLRAGTHLEARLRITFLRKIPRLGDRYFRTRLVSDLAERGHSAHSVRAIPTLGRQLLTTLFELLVTTAAIGIIDPHSMPAALVAVAVAVGLPLAMRIPVAERDYRVRTHRGALSRHYLDALLGLVSVRAHGAERAVRREYDLKLAQWVDASYGLLRVVSAQQCVQLVGGLLCVAWLVLGYAERSGDAHGLLLLTYWALRLPQIAEAAVTRVTRYRQLHNITQRLVEPIRAPDGADEPRQPPTCESSAEQATALGIQMRDVSVVEGGHTILHGVDLDVRPGEHLAVVGPSGAGKSTLAGLLLGWSQPARGRVTIDRGGRAIGRRSELREQIAWVDPSVALWNRSLLENLSYGSPTSAPPLAHCIHEAELLPVLERLPHGMQTQLGEGGGLVSGGEGQRVRLARAMARPDARLVVLDEAFRGLDREQRRRLLGRAREYWQGATIVCITHDVAHTQDFDRVAVVEHGTVVECAPPSRLLADPRSHYRRLLDAQRAVFEEVWGNPRWRSATLCDGVVTPEPTEVP